MARAWKAGANLTRSVCCNRSALSLRWAKGETHALAYYRCTVAACIPGHLLVWRHTVPGFYHYTVDYGAAAGATTSCLQTYQPAICTGHFACCNAGDPGRPSARNRVRPGQEPGLPVRNGLRHHLFHRLPGGAGDIYVGAVCHNTDS